MDLESSQQVTIPGKKLKIVKRTYEEGESFNKRIEKTISGSGTDTKIYPLFDLEALSPGTYGNRTGVKLWYDPNGDREDFGLLNNIAFFNITAVDKEYDSDIAYPVRNSWGTAYTTFCFKPDVVGRNLRTLCPCK